jgi:Zn finger protein HypA/HybF involved in hydrogenase expression
MYPRLKVVIRDSKNNEVDKDDKGTIRNILMQKNELEEVEGFHMEVLEKFTPKGNSDITFLTLEVDTKTKQKILGSRIVKGESIVAYGAGFHSVMEDVKVKICYRCQGYNHISKNCNLSEKNEFKCKFCSGNHDSKECNKKSNPLCCPNCKSKNDKIGSEDKQDRVDVRHAAHTMKCGIYLAELQSVKSKNI